MRAAVQDHDQGVFQPSALLADTMRADDRVGACLASLTSAIVDAKITVDPSTGSKRDNPRLFAAWKRILPRDVLAQIVHWVEMLGFAVCELVWATTDEQWIPTVKVWCPQYVYYDWGARKYAVITAEEIIHIDESVRDKWFVISPHGTYRGWLGGAVRALGEVWLRRRFALRDWSRLVEVYGLPIRKAIVPGSASSTDKRRFFERVASLSTETTIECPTGISSDSPGYDVKFELASGTEGGAAVIREIVEQCDRTIAIRLLGQNLTTEAGSGVGGTYASASVHQEEFERVVSGFCRFLSDAINENIVSRWATYNATSLPRVELDACTGDDVSKIAASASAAAAAVSQLAAAGYEIDLADLTSRLGLPKISKAAMAPVALRAVDPVAEVDASVYAGARTGHAAMRVLAERLRDAIDDASDLGDVRARVLEVARSHDVSDLQSEIEAGILNAHLAGRATT